MESETNSSLGSKSEKSRTMITYDFFGGSSSSSLQPQELDLDFHVPSGWKRHLDLKVRRTLHFVFFTLKDINFIHVPTLSLKIMDPVLKHVGFCHFVYKG